MEKEIKPKVKTILVSQPKPETEKSPYFDMAKKYNVKIDFKPFIKVEGIPASDFRKDKISILDHTAIIFTSRNAVDHFFRICTEMRITVPESMKYFCISESTAYYLQKYVIYRKRKIFCGKSTLKDLSEVIKKHKDEKFLLPSTDIYKEETPQTLEEFGISYNQAIIYRTVASDFSDMPDLHYDMILFFSPSGIRSLFKNYPNFVQGDIRIGCFGHTTAKAVQEQGLRLDIMAPNPQAPSMTMALENYLKESNKK